MAAPSGLGVTLLLEELEGKLHVDDTPCKSVPHRADSLEEDISIVAAESPTAAFISELCRELDIEASRRNSHMQDTEEPPRPQHVNLSEKSEELSHIPSSSNPCIGYGSNDLDDLIVQGVALLVDGNHDGPQMLRIDRANLENKENKDCHQTAWDFWKPHDERDDDQHSNSFGSTCASSCGGVLNSSAYL
mmetsp:Transcript_55822/g.88470  ORF Transcript_55822/g.88470 Transcript_55822/m.88470 type:complete len:190 (+) Transcript_55822:50-619(+)|eukprot:CAMPEP_0169112466 /NCGR_PEP_ID=MMETSP1015-20121227/27657_1 /TAXON_ID=342587 /ORGANISM="Karlodinium micrum, Strain CCMP2283" /LENGTH=189 /DNA_ID=CAMNT_0009174519 /DNA_START=50 /DNA_END=619 /DNA_ORIENTATION=-